MPGANFWAVLLFMTLIVLGFSSALVILDVVATLLMDFGVRYSRLVIATALMLLVSDVSPIRYRVRLLSSRWSGSLDQQYALMFVSSSRISSVP
jgi:SNF family Na+-dependent transporter